MFGIWKFITTQVMALILGEIKACCSTLRCSDL